MEIHRLVTGERLGPCLDWRRSTRGRPRFDFGRITFRRRASALQGRQGRVAGWPGRGASGTNILLVLPLFGIWVLLPGLVAEPIVKERKVRLRNLLAVSGLDHRAYWLGSFG